MGSGGVLSIETAVVELTESYARQRPGVSVQPGAYAVLTVTDTGHGMDRETVSHLFEPFFTTKPVGQGTGLGLSVVYGIVKQSGGYVWAYSEPGLGSSFRVYLPLAEMPASAVMEQPRRPRTKSGETILVVEDDAEVRRQVVRGLEEEGFTVAQAEHGAEALDVARRLAEIRPDLPVLSSRAIPARTWCSGDCWTRAVRSSRSPSRRRRWRRRSASCSGAGDGPVPSLARRVRAV